MVNYNIRFTNMKLSHYWNLLGLLVSLTHLANGQVVFDFQGTSCESQDITLGCTISSFTTDAIWKRGNGSVLAVTCSSAGPCSQVSQNIDGTTYSFQGNTSGIYMSTTLPPSEHGVNWTCTYSGTDHIYQFELGCSEVTTEGSTEGSNPCVGTHKFVLTTCCCIGGSKSTTIVILIIIYCCCGQRVKITVIADKKKTLIAAKQKINGENQQQIPIEQKSRCSFVARGRETHECEFGTDGMVRFKFMIEDDLLYVKRCQTITLPTVLEVDPMFSTITWFHNGQIFEHNRLQFTTKVTPTTYGVYDIKLTFEQRELTILIENMCVQGRYWMVMIISVGFNEVCDVISLFITVLCRSRDGFCVELYITIPLHLVSMFGVIWLVIALVNFLFLKRTGNEKSKGQEQANAVTTTSQTGAVSPTVVTTTSTTSGTSPSAVTTTSSMGVVSSSDVAATTSDDQDRRSLRPLPLPENYKVKKMPFTNDEGNDRNLKENAEQIKLIDKKL